MMGEYQAEEGMTWAEWCDSEYNTSGCQIIRNKVCTNPDEQDTYKQLFVSIDFYRVMMDDVIDSNQRYSMLNEWEEEM